MGDEELNVNLSELVPMTDEHREALRTRPWIQTLERDFTSGVLHGGMVSAFLKHFVPAMYTEATAMAVAQAMVEITHKMLPAEGPKGEPPSVRDLLGEGGLGELLEPVNLKMVDFFESDDSKDGLGSLWRYITQSGVVRSWAALEAMTEDLWIGALNAAGPSLRQQAFSSVNKATGDGKGTTGKTIDISIFAKHDFNLQNKLGTVLAPKLSFKTVSGICAAYKAAFGFDSRRSAPSFQDSDVLRPIEAMRHVIVHRGGWIDEEYAGKVGLAATMIGKQLEFNDKAAMTTMGAIAMQGVYLLRRTAAWLQATDPITPAEESASPEPD